jgi:hypothetical protein
MVVIGKVHSEVLINPYFGLPLSIESDHVLSDATWDDKFADVIKSSKSVV